MMLPTDRHPLRILAIVLLCGTLLTLRAIAQEPARTGEPAPDPRLQPATPIASTSARTEHAVAGLPTDRGARDSSGHPRDRRDPGDSSTGARDSSESEAPGIGGAMHDADVEARESGGVPFDSAAGATAATVTADGPESIDSAHALEPPRLRLDEYHYAGTQRFTMHGKMPFRETHVETATLATFGGALLALAGSITWYQQAWYPDSTKAPFHFQTDWGYSKQFDKAGHMYGGWMASYCSYEAFIASGFDREDAAFWGMLGGLFFQTVMEVQDGFFSYGFDPTDAISNAIGSGVFYLQHHVPVLQYFHPKWSFGPNPRDSAREAAQIRSRIIADDYDRQDVWLSAKVHYLLPEPWREYWPKWLCLAVGAGARDVELIGYRPYRVVHIALDYDLVEMLPDLGSFGNWLVQGINSFKFLPAPALQVWPHVAFKLVYPFTL